MPSRTPGYSGYGERTIHDLIRMEQRRLLELEAVAARQRITDPDLRRQIAEQRRRVAELQARAR